MLMVALAGVGVAGCGAQQAVVPTPRPESRVTCRELVADLPATVASQESVATDPSSPLVAAWGDPAVVVRCGVPPAPAISKTATCQVVDGVAWFVPVGQIDDQAADVVATTFGRRPVVQLRIPAAYRPPVDVFVDVTGAVKAHTVRQREC